MITREELDEALAAQTLDLHKRFTESMDEMKVVLGTAVKECFAGYEKVIDQLHGANNKLTSRVTELENKINNLGQNLGNVQVSDDSGAACPSTASTHDFIGVYECHVYDNTSFKNNWHYVTITSNEEGSTYRWKNRAGVEWGLKRKDDDTLSVDVDCPYYVNGFREVKFDGGGLFGPGGEYYKRGDGGSNVDNPDPLPDIFVGHYVNDIRKKTENHHYVTISYDPEVKIYIWKNRAGLAFTLIPKDDKTLTIGDDCPYYVQGFIEAQFTDDGFIGPHNEFYRRTGAPKPLSVNISPLYEFTGDYQCHLYDPNPNEWHYVTITHNRDTDTYLWTNRAGVKWALMPIAGSRERLSVGMECPYYQNGHTEVRFTENGLYGPFNEFYERGLSPVSQPTPAPSFNSVRDTQTQSTSDADLYSADRYSCLAYLKS